MSDQVDPRLGKARTAEFIGSWRSALRIARRETRRARGRTALVLSMIILPVLALTFVAVSVDMSRLTPAEKLDRTLADADAQLRVVRNAPIRQSADGDDWWPVGEDVEESEALAKVSAEQVAALLPAGSRVLPVTHWVPFPVRDGDRVRDHLNATVVDLTDPLGHGLARVHAGRVPAGADEVAVNPATRRQLDLDLGDQVAAGNNSRSWTVVGVVEFPGRLSPGVALHPTGSPTTTGGTDPDFLVDLPTPMTTELFRQLNEQGVVVTARIAEPPPTVVADGRFDLATSGEEIGSGLLVAGLGLLEVVLLVGPAFAVGVRRRRRDLALVSVAGGDAAQLRRVVLADGVILGCIGAAIGIALGVAVAFATRPLVEEFIVQHRFGGYRVWPAALVVIGLVAVLAGVLAALAPAWTAAREDVVAGLAGRRTPPVRPRRWLVIGVLLSVGGVGVAALGAVVTSQATILAGLLLGELGLVFATPTLVGMVARAGRFLPLAPRIALRDASRNRSSAAPAISAVMAAVAGSVALGLFLASEQARDEERFRPMVPEGSVLVWADQWPEAPSPPTLAEITGPAREHLGARTIAPLVSAGCLPEHEECQFSPVLPAERACPWQAEQTLSEADRRRARADDRCQGLPDAYYGPYFQVAVDDGSALPILTGAGPEETAAATAVLRAGGVVVTDPRYLLNGHLELRYQESSDGPLGGHTRSVTVPGHAVDNDLGSDWILLSQAVTDRLGVVTRHVGWAMDGTPDPDRHEEFTAAMRPLGSFSVETRDDSRHGGTVRMLLLLAGVSAVVTVGAAGIATGLAAAEGRADLSTLAAVGASPGVRRLLSLCQAGVIAVLGSLLGIIAGLGAALIILFFTNRQYAQAWPIEPPYPFVVPWLTLGVLVVVPLVAMLGAALFTRSRLPVERRLD
ncbi:FtsX-like permease family protein [Micromonospora sp. DT229]|uniref:FtsX-like permease family protein n=1 Tax=Micromonospora sp. DT229 TaxID=3393430 RepID=UPI003CF6B21A